MRDKQVRSVMSLLPFLKFGDVVGDHLSFRRNCPARKAFIKDDGGGNDFREEAAVEDGIGRHGLGLRKPAPVSPYALR